MSNKLWTRYSITLYDLLQDPDYSTLVHDSFKEVYTDLFANNTYFEKYNSFVQSLINAFEIYFIKYYSIYEIGATTPAEFAFFLKAQAANTFVRHFTQEYFKNELSKQDIEALILVQSQNTTINNSSTDYDLPRTGINENKGNPSSINENRNISNMDLKESTKDVLLQLSKETTNLFFEMAEEFKTCFACIYY